MLKSNLHDRAHDVNRKGKKCTDDWTTDDDWMATPVPRDHHGKFALALSNLPDTCNMVSWLPSAQTALGGYTPVIEKL